MVEKKLSLKQPTYTHFEKLSRCVRVLGEGGGGVRGVTFHNSVTRGWNIVQYGRCPIFLLSSSLDPIQPSSHVS
jgi:hypothetical protein